MFIHFLVRILLSQTLQVDDAEQIDHAQNLLLGYPIPQPPLYSWLSWSMFEIFGTGLLALTILKYVLIALTFWLTWLVSNQLFQHLQTRYIATFSYLLMPSFAWHMHQGFTHTILLGFGIILSLHALLRVKDSPNLKNYAYLGFAFGIGLMAKYSFLLFMIPVLISALSISSFRKAILQPKFLLTLLVFILIIAPHAYWLTQHYQEVFGSIDQKLKVTNDNLLLDRMKSAGKFAGAAIAFVVPFAIVSIISSWKRLFNIDKQSEQSDGFILLNRFYLVIIASVIVLAMFVSMPHFKVRWFHPLMMIFPLWILGRIERKELLSKAVMRWFTGTTIAFTILILSVRILQVTIGPELGNYGRLNRPIIETFEKLPAYLTDNSILITKDGFIGSHLLSHYQQQSIVIEGRRFREKNAKTSMQCLWLWDDDDLSTSMGPNLDKTVKSGKLITQIADKHYTLSYALTDKRECVEN